ncbi:cytochrome P450 4V2-like [Danaus plexippus]|uniref:cytochrome P450 4V2-like n=1 Tax=Danaus plexippus TaxID=13037 RepID=UPI002AB20E8F|nr:cytochrome P450 4V2-like [Danaus plexippus]XP_061380121.1 cytochrome P450 4V2-like [Danaus plexippus]
MITIALLFVLTSLSFVLLYWFRSNGNKLEPPLADKKRFLIGHAQYFYGGSEALWENISILTEQSRKYDGVLKLIIGLQNSYFVADPDDFATVMNSCLLKLKIVDFAKPWLGNGLVTASPSIWKAHRRLINPSFNQHVVDSFLGIFNSQSRRFVRSLEVEVGKGPFDHYVYCHRIALETICQTALGDDFMNNSSKSSEYVCTIDKMLNILISRFQKFWLHPDIIYNFSSVKRQEKDCIKILHEGSTAILQKKKESYMKEMSSMDEKFNRTKFKPFIQLLLELSHNTKVLTEDEIKEHVDTIIVSGSDTSGGTITYCMLLIGSYPRVQNKIIEELHTVFGNDDRDVTKEDLSKLVYLDAVIKESIRLYPTVALTGRDIEEDLKLRNYTLSKGASVYLSIYALYHHPQWGPDVEEFKPERWLDPSLLPSWANSIGFGVGRRFCIGKTYALMSIKTTMVHVCRNFLIYGNHKNMKLKLDVLLKPASGHYITIKKRT